MSPSAADQRGLDVCKSTPTAYPFNDIANYKVRPGFGRNDQSLPRRKILFTGGEQVGLSQ